jgi:hypothetical protein
MALSREEVNRLLADAATAQRGQIHQMWTDTRLSQVQIDELRTVDARDRKDRAREMVALEGRPWHREMEAQIEHMNTAEAAPRHPVSRELREIAVPLDDLNAPPGEP